MNPPRRQVNQLSRQPSKQLAILVVLFGLMSLLGACASSTSTGDVGADRSQLLLVPSEKLEQMGSEAYAALKADAAKKGVLNTKPAMLQRLRAIAKRIIPQTEVFRDDAPGWDWEVNLITSDQLNAFVMPGGKIMFYTGIIERLNLTDPEIAVIMGHEIAHALREHAREQVSQAMAAQTAIGIGASVLGLGEASANLAGAGYQALVATKFSRTHEAEADRIGLELSARAGYDPRAGISLWRKMGAAKDGSQPPEFLSSHPTDASRIQRIESLLPTVLPLYERASRR